MNMSDWAENEVKIACEREAPDREEGEWDYGCACYESALKAFKSLREDRHSGFSIGLTKNILNRLIDGKPLTPITEKDFYIPEDKEMVGDSPEYLKARGLKSSIQCPRMSSLFRDEKLDGTVEYFDVNRAVCVDINNPEFGGYYNRFVMEIALEDFPIKLPYYPSSNSYKIYTEDFLTDEKHGCFDTIGIFYMITPELDKVEINRYFNLDEDEPVEISKEEYEKRKARKINV